MNLKQEILNKKESDYGVRDIACEKFNNRAIQGTNERNLNRR